MLLDTPQSGQWVGAHRLVERLPGGSMGPVWRAQGLDGQPAVVKFCAVRADPAAGEALRRFEQEARVVERLRHPDIVRLLAFGAEPHWSWLAFAYVDGPDLSQFTGGARRLQARLAAGLIAQAADALDHAHRHGIVHRDVKPANIRIDRARRRACLLDFGLAAELASDRSATGASAGSPAYMAPELLAGQAPSIASDVFALGVTLYELLAGERPWAAPSLGALLRAIAQNPAPDLRERRADLPDGLVWAVEAALRADPSRRTPGAAAFARQVRRAVQLPAGT